MIPKHILVLGSGSVGRRHMKNFASLGCAISAMDTRNDRLDEAGKEVEIKNKFLSAEEAFLNSQKFDAVVVASPPKFHIEQTIAALQANLPVLLEKPLTKTLGEAKLLSNFLTSNRPPLILGYTYRWWPSLAEMKNKIVAGEIGKPLFAAFQMSAHLADWHPWERYQDFFMASKDLGGGALLDESHWLDLMIWFFGMPEKIFADIGKISGLEIDTDDNVNILAFYPNGFRVNLHLDIYGRPHRKSIAVLGEGRSLDWHFENELDRNLMFAEMANDFLKLINGSKPSKICGIDDGMRVLQIIEAVRKSSMENKPVLLK